MSKRNKNRRNPEKDTLPLQPGDRLRLARESRDLSIEDVATRLKLDVGKISALEQGDIAGFAAPVFAAGYLRAYARLLELSEAEVLADFDELTSMQEQVIDPAPTGNNETCGKMTSGISSQFSLRDKSSGNHLGKAGLASVFIVGLVYFLWPVNEGEQTDAVSSKINTRLTEQAVEMAVPSLEVVTEEKVGDTQATEIQSPVAEHVVETGQSEWVSPEMPAEPVVVPEVETETLAAGLSSELVLIFNSDSWAEVQDAQGQRLVYHLGKSGTRSVVKGIAPFMVQLGYVQGVDILYNGVPYDLSKYANRRSVRLRIGVAGEQMDGE
ncbi:MAG: helix-turn-helix domain-containing protein [Gammaproteobacteria bacterium]|nr:helix-turn-helix domain-containing protein [Gammaproteobacteria bacterium]